MRQLVIHKHAHRMLERLLYFIFICSTFLKCTQSHFTSRRGRTFEAVDVSRMEAGIHARKFQRSCSSTATIVTAYYNLRARSKHSETNFETWNSRFFSLRDNMVIFSDHTSSEAIIQVRNKSRGCTLLVRQALSDTEMFGVTNWELQHQKDPENLHHSIELYIVWDQKPLWLEAIANLNPFQSTHFFWADSGQFRDDAFLRAHIPKGEKWVTSTEFIPACKSLFLSIEKFEPHELVKDSSEMTPPLNSELVRLGGGNFGGDVCSVLKFAQRYRSQIRRYLDEGFFIGKDQPIYGSICTSWRDMCFLVDAAKVTQVNDRWFAAQPLLHGESRPVPEYVLPS